MKSPTRPRKRNTSATKKDRALELKLLRETGIADVGDQGFEGLVARLLQAVVKEPFRVVRSGSQRGRDAASNCIFVECKYYDPNGTVPLADINQKITEAARDNPGVDLWVLVTTTIVDANLAASVRQKGDETGIGTLILDGDATSPFSLMALLAASPTTVREYFAYFHPNTNIDALMAAIVVRAQQADTRLADLRAHLQKGYLGQAHLRERCAAFYSSLLDSGLGFFEKYGRHATREQLTTRFVRRRALSQALDMWRAQPTRAAVVLGNEGVGKTTALLEWFLQQASNRSASLDLFATASSLDAPDLFGTIEQIFSDIFPQTARDVWRTRIARWRTEGSAPIVLVVDGLNERPATQWQEWFAASATDRSAPAVALLVTCWPSYWVEAVKARLPPPELAVPGAGVSRVQEIHLGDFDDVERGHLLRCWGRALDDFPLEAQSNLFHPRTGALLCRHYDDLRQAGDFTASRILFESYRERASHNKGSPLTAQGFDRLIRGLVSADQTGRLRDDELRPIIRDLFGQEREESIVTEVCHSGVFSTTNHADGSLTVDDNKVRYGLGLVLFADCKTIAPTEVCDWLVQRVSEDGGLSNQVQVIASAFYHATRNNADPRVVVAITFTLLHFKNFLSDDVLTTFVRMYLRTRPNIACELVELLFQKSSMGGVNEWLASLLIECRADEATCLVVDTWIVRCLSLVHEDALWPFSHRRDDGQRVSVNARLEELSAITNLSSPPPGAKILTAETADVPRVGRFALYVASAGARSSLLSAIVHWAVSRTVMGGLIEQDEMQWVLRLTDEDLAGPLIDGARAWAATGTSLGTKIAHLILRILGTQAAAEALSPLPPPPKSAAWLEYERERAANPCSYNTPWSDDDHRDCLDRPSTTLRLAKAGLAERLFDPSLKLPAHLINQVVSYAGSIDPHKHFTVMGRTIADSQFEDAAAFLIAAEPRCFRDMVHRLVSTLPTREGIALRQLSIQLPDFSPLFNAVDLAQLRLRLATLWASAAWVSDKKQIPEDLRLVESQLVEAMLPHLSAREQLDLLLCRPYGSWNLLKWEGLFRQLEPEDEGSAIQQVLLVTCPRKQESLLWFVARPSLAIPDALAERVTDLTQSEVIGLRHAAYYFVFVVQSEALDELVRERILTGTPQVAEVTPAAQYASYILARNTNVPIGRIEPYLLPGLFSQILKQRRFLPDDLAWFAQGLDSLLFGGLPEIPEPIDVSVKWPDQEGKVANFDVEVPKPASSIRNTFASWRESDDDAAIRALAESDEDAAQHRQNAIDKIRSVWKTAAGQLYGWHTSIDTLEALFRFDAASTGRWVDQLCADRHFPDTNRWRLLQSTILAIELALWRISQPLAVRLWERLWRTGFGCDALTEHAFIASDGPEANACRKFVFDACDSDDRLLNIALFSERYGRTAWLSEAIDEGLASPALWRRARSLTLAAFTSADECTFEAYVTRADITSTWVSECVPSLFRALQCNRWAREWYDIFTTTNEDTQAWAAFAAIARIADPRWELWGAPDANETYRKFSRSDVLIRMT